MHLFLDRRGEHCLLFFETGLDHPYCTWSQARGLAERIVMQKVIHRDCVLAKVATCHLHCRIVGSTTGLQDD